MNIPKAIEILKDRLLYSEPDDDPDEADATKLAIEALTYIMLLHQTNPDLVPALFHSETAASDPRH